MVKLMVNYALILDFYAVKFECKKAKELTSMWHGYYIAPQVDFIVIDINEVLIPWLFQERGALGDSFLKPTIYPQALPDRMQLQRNNNSL